MADKSYKLYSIKNKLSNPYRRGNHVIEDSESMSSFELDGPGMQKNVIEDTLDLDLNDRTFGGTKGPKM